MFEKTKDILTNDLLRIALIQTFRLLRSISETLGYKRLALFFKLLELILEIVGLLLS